MINLKKYLFFCILLAFSYAVVTVDPNDASCFAEIKLGQKLPVAKFTVSGATVSNIIIQNNGAVAFTLKGIKRVSIYQSSTGLTPEIAASTLFDSTNKKLVSLSSSFAAGDYYIFYEVASDATPELYAQVALIEYSDSNTPNQTISNSDQPKNIQLLPSGLTYVQSRFMGLAPSQNISRGLSNIPEIGRAHV